MAAPASSYHTKLLNRKSFPVESFQIARLLPEYYDWTTVKGLFFLDMIIKLRDIVTNDLYFVGCVIPGGENASYHNSSRIGGTKLNGNNLLLDSLNTKGTVLAVSFKSFLSEGGVKFSGVFKSSYYNNTTDYGVYFVNNSEPVRRSFYGAEIDPKQSVQKTDFVVSNLDGENRVAGEELLVAPYIENSEGIKIFDYVAVQIAPFVLWMKYTDIQYTCIENAAQALFTTSKGTDDSIGIVGFSRWRKNPDLAPDGRIRVYKPAKTPSEIAELERDYLMSDMLDGTNGMLGFFQDEEKLDVNGDRVADTYQVVDYNNLPYITDFIEYKFLDALYQEYQGNFQSVDQFSIPYDIETTYVLSNISSDVGEWMKNGFNPNEWSNPVYTYQLTANKNDFAKRYVEGGVTKYLYYTTYASTKATGFIVFPIDGDAVNYGWKFFQDGREIFSGTRAFPSGW